MSNFETNKSNETTEKQKGEGSIASKKEYTPYVPKADIKNEDIPNPEQAFDDFKNPLIEDGEIFDNSIDPKRKFDFSQESDRIKVLKILWDYNDAKTNKSEELKVYYTKISELLSSNRVDFQKIIEESAWHIMAWVTLDNNTLKVALVNKYQSYLKDSDAASLSDATMKWNKWNTLTNTIFQKYWATSKQYKIVSRFDEIAKN